MSPVIIYNVLPQKYDFIIIIIINNNSNNTIENDIFLINNNNNSIIIIIIITKCYIFFFTNKQYIYLWFNIMVMMFLLGIIINSLFYIQNPNQKRKRNAFFLFKKDKLFIFFLNHRQLFLNI